MKKRNRMIAYVVSLIMACTCFTPVVDHVYATNDSGQTQPAETAQTTDPDVNYTGMKNGVYYEKGKPKNGWANKKYYKKGKLLTGWDKKIYYKKGRKWTGWVVKDGKKTHYCTKGKPKKGIKKIKKTWYEFNKKSGKLKRKIGDNMDKKAQKYRSNRKYLVLVNYKKHQVRIYKGKKNKWKRVKKFKCSMGRSSTPTPTGTFKITSRGRYFNTGSSARCWYWTGFIGCIYLFHSVLYNRNSRPSHVIDGRLGRNISHGCIRLKLRNARWIYNNVPRGSKVVIKRKF